MSNRALILAGLAVIGVFNVAVWRSCNSGHDVLAVTETPYHDCGGNRTVQRACIDHEASPGISFKVGEHLVEPRYCRWSDQKLYDFSVSDTHVDPEWLAERWEKWGGYLDKTLQQQCVPYIVAGRTLCMMKEGTMCTTDYDIDTKFMCATDAIQATIKEKVFPKVAGFGFDPMTNNFLYPDSRNFDKICVCPIEGYNFLCHDDAFLDDVTRYGTSWYLALPMGKGFLTKKTQTEFWGNLKPGHFNQYLCGFMNTLAWLDTDEDGFISSAEVEAIMGPDELHYFHNNVIESARLLSWIYMWISDYNNVRREDFWEKINIEIIPDLAKIKAVGKKCYDHNKKLEYLAKFS